MLLKLLYLYKKTKHKLLIWFTVNTDGFVLWLHYLMEFG